jgi:hypothetical protein
MENQEIVLAEEEYYDLFKALRFAIESLPDFMKQHKTLLEDMTKLYATSEGSCEFVISCRVIKEEADPEAEALLENFRIEIQQGPGMA